MTKQRRVLLLTETGASCRYIEAAVEILAPHFDLTVGTLGMEGPLHEASRRLGVEVLALNRSSRPGYMTAPIPLAHAFRDDRFDLVHAHEVLPATVAAVAKSIRRNGIPIVFHRHHGLSEGPHARLSRFAARQAALTVGVSDFAARLAHESDGVPVNRTATVHNGVPPLRPVSTEEITSLKEGLRIPRDAPVVVMVSRFRREKGHHVLIEAARHLRGTGCDHHLVMVGDGPEAPRLAGLFQHDETIHLVGHQDDVSPWYHLADVVAQPSLRESFGLSVVEAMAAARPVVASRVGGLCEIVVDGVTGILVPPEDPIALSNGLRDVLADDSRSARLGQQGFLRFNSLFTVACMASGWQTCYERVMQGGTHVPAQ